MPTSKSKQTFVWQPFTEAGIRLPGSEEWLWFGRLEEGSKISLSPRYVGYAHDERYVYSEVLVECYDLDADFDNEYNWLKHMNKQVYFAAYMYGGGGFIDGAWRYTVRQEHFPNRGFRLVHRLTARVYWLPTQTYLSRTAWSQFLKAAKIVQD